MFAEMGGGEGTRWDVRRFASIDSTNTALLAAAREGAAEGLVYLADHQTAGRGRLDRRWEASPGSSLLVSVLLRPSIAPSRAHWVTAVVGLAASDACASVAGVDALLKWPNDLVVDDRKLGGILAEAVVEGGAVRAVVVGMGLNVNWPTPLPGELEATATACNLVAGHEVDRDALFDAFLDRLAVRYDALERPSTLSDLRDRSATLGRAVRVELPADRVVVGRAVDLAEDGALLVETRPGEVIRVSVGDVIHLRPR
jgi:BirA family transcriptional regulator, biotin operon repressor / biotin---[acetyl-CoA-carboxylase] ligase